MTAAKVTGVSVTRAEAAAAEAESLLLQRRLPSARAHCVQALSLGADANRCAGMLWEIEMLSGEFEQAWLQSDLLRRRGAPDPHRFWQGEKVAGQRVIVRCLRGLGDAVQMLRYAPKLKQAARSVVWEVPPALLPLARSFSSVDEAVTWGIGAPETPTHWDVQIEVMELPYLFRTTVRDLPLVSPYLAVSEPWAFGPKTKPRIGLVWCASDWNPLRNVAFDSITTLLADDRFEFWSLQMEPVVACGLRHDRLLSGNGLLPLAQAIATLDLVITVDTLAAHLAGALGRPAWLLLQYAADWRWMHDRDDSPWYPSLTLFRQPSPGAWAASMEQVRQRLATLNL